MRDMRSRLTRDVRGVKPSLRFPPHGAIKMYLLRLELDFLEEAAGHVER
jgi:hypothetical protein